VTYNYTDDVMQYTILSAVVDIHLDSRHFESKRLLKFLVNYIM